MGITAFYESTVRSRRWGTPCIKCRRHMDKGEKCMREQLGYNQYQCMQYNEYCMKCYKRVYKAELIKQYKALEKEIKEMIKFKGELKKLKAKKP